MDTKKELVHISQILDIYSVDLEAERMLNE